MDETVIDGEQIRYSVRESARATRPRLTADQRGITVVVPEGHSIDPERLLDQKQDWVLERWQEHQAFLDRLPERRFVDGASFPFLGQDHTVRVLDQQARERQDGELRLPRRRVEESGIPTQLERLYRSEARAVFQRYIDRYSEAIEGTPEKLYVRDQRTRWGSCSGKDNISLNWRLVLGPEEVVEYVVVHELVHLEHRDHSEMFWDRVADLVPEYQAARDWLADNDHQLIFRPADVGPD